MVRWPGLLLLLGLLAGCSPTEQPAVYVDVIQLAPLLAATPNVPAVTPVPISASISVSGTQGRLLFSGLTKEELAESEAQIRTTQNEAIRRIMAQRLKVLDAEIESALAASRGRLEPKHQMIMQDAIAQTRIPFDKMAPRVGELTLELTNLIGFPDRGQAYRLVDAEWSQNRAKRIEAIRAELAQLNATYLAERTAILDQAYRLIARDDETLLTNASVARKEGEARITTELQKLSEDGESAQAEHLPPASSQLLLPASRAQSVRVHAGNEAFPPISAGPSERSPLWAAVQKAKIWASSQGYRLVSSRSQGRDATLECMKWIQEQTVGH
ncbi:MAG: hypothetical protein IT205_00255 [Fimbriimonadaceae bacterium]|nr:hypothetical protein [Fimbriimonadaceae bacterium]